MLSCSIKEKIMAKRTCLLCQTQYKYCPYCAEDANKPKWKFLFHDKNCANIFDALQRHEQNLYTDEEAIEKLKNCDLSVLKTATTAVNNQVKRILAKEKAKKIAENPDVKVSEKAKENQKTTKKEIIETVKK